MVSLKTIQLADIYVINDCVTDVTISISTPSVIVSEPDGTATVCVEIESGTLTTGTAVVTFSTGGGSATGITNIHS